MLRFLAFLLIALVTAPAAAQSFASERIGVTVTGSGPDVVLIPGLSSHPDVWRDTVAAVPGYRYHLIHVSGFAGRPAGANASGPVFEPVAGEIARYIREARLQRPALVGHSMGGSWAMVVAARNPGLVGKVMVVDMMPFMGVIFGAPNAEAVRPFAEQMKARMLGAAPEARRAQIEQTIATMVRTESLRPGVVEQSLASDPVVSTQAFYDVLVADLRPDLPNLGVPLTVLWVAPPGAPVTPEQLTQIYAASYAGASGAAIRQIPDAYHFIMYDQPQAFQREFRAFLQGS
jgi:pimeloyl-ACP methyl ester carboxylesterase